jgi:hypothetical protein
MCPSTGERPGCGRTTGELRTRARELDTQEAPCRHLPSHGIAGLTRRISRSKSHQRPGAPRGIAYLLGALSGGETTGSCCQHQTQWAHTPQEAPTNATARWRGFLVLMFPGAGVHAIPQCRFPVKHRAQRNRGPLTSVEITPSLTHRLLPLATHSSGYRCRRYHPRSRPWRS